MKKEKKQLGGMVQQVGQDDLEWRRRHNPRKKTRKKKRGMQEGGYIKGPLHTEGGVPAIVDGTERVELEGTEYIIQGKAVKKYGVETIDKINKMKVDPKQLRKLKKGGRVRKKMAGGGRTRSTKINVSELLNSGAQIGIEYGPIPSTGRKFYIDENHNLNMVPNSVPSTPEEYEWIAKHMWRGKGGSTAMKMQTGGSLPNITPGVLGECPPGACECPGGACLPACCDLGINPYSKNVTFRPKSQNGNDHHYLGNSNNRRNNMAKTKKMHSGGNWHNLKHRMMRAVGAREHDDWRKGGPVSKKMHSGGTWHNLKHRMMRAVGAREHDDWRKGGPVSNKRIKRRKTRGYQSGGPMINNPSKTHPHRYASKTRRHWSRFPGGAAVPPLGYEHRHAADGRPPTQHFHQFSSGVQQHWGQHPGGHGEGTRGYRHNHPRPTPVPGGPGLPPRTVELYRTGGSTAKHLNPHLKSAVAEAKKENKIMSTTRSNNQAVNGTPIYKEGGRLIVKS